MEIDGSDQWKTAFLTAKNKQMKEALPIELDRNIGSEKKEFMVRSKRDRPIGKIIYQLSFGIIWTSISVFMLGLVYMRSHNELLPILFMGFFTLVGILMLVSAIDMLLKKGSLYVGTPKRLVIFRKGNVRSIDWEQFTGDITANANSDGGSILFKLRTGVMQKQEDIPEMFVPEEIYISGINNLSEMERICRERIKENDPTLARVQ